jgi:hypothetical protein
MQSLCENQRMHYKDRIKSVYKQYQYWIEFKPILEKSSRISMYSFLSLCFLIGY